MKIRSALAAAMMIAGSLVGVAGVATPASAAVDCTWYVFGSSSNCDNLPAAECSEWEDVRTRTIGPGIVVTLWYSLPCRTVVGEISATIGDLYTDNCYVKVERNYDREILRQGVEQQSRFPNFYWALTNMLYDARVSSFAWGYCRLSNGAVYSGATESW
jgi:hypothetical protein